MNGYEAFSVLYESAVGDKARELKNVASTKAREAGAKMREKSDERYVNKKLREEERNRKYLEASSKARRERIDADPNLTDYEKEIHKAFAPEKFY